jgi:hypothetical protein
MLYLEVRGIDGGLGSSGGKRVTLTRYELQNTKMIVYAPRRFLEKTTHI